VGGNGVALLAHAGGHADIESNAMVQVVQITDDREAELATVCERVDGLSMDDASAMSTC